MFCRGGNGKFVALTTLAFNNAGQWIVLSGSFAFIEKKLLDLFIVCIEKCSIEIEKAPWFTGTNLDASRANCDLWRAPVFVLVIHRICICRGPAPVRINSATAFTNCGLADRARRTMPAGGRDRLAW